MEKELPADRDSRETSLGKALRLMTAVAEGREAGGVSVATLVHKTGLSRPTTYRFLNELREFGLVRSAPRQALWRLGPKIVALAAMSSDWASLRRRARESMEDFVRNVGYTVHLGIRDGLEVVYIDKAENSGFASVASTIGQRRPLSATAMGKCLVAFDYEPEQLVEQIVAGGFTVRTDRSITTAEALREALERVRQDGLAYDDGECDVGSRCVAAPVFDGQGYAIAAISISAISRPGQRDVLEMGDEARRLASAISGL